MDLIATKVIGFFSAVATTLGLKWKLVAWSAIGAAVGAFLRPGTKTAKFLCGFVGFAFAVTIGPIFAHAAVATLPSSWAVDFETVLPGAGFLCGSCGMFMMEAIISAASRVRENLPNMIDRSMGRD